MFLVVGGNPNRDRLLRRKKWYETPRFMGFIYAAASIGIAIWPTCTINPAIANENN